MKRIDGSDVMTIIGLALLCGGLAAFDWRLALIACGLVLLLLGLAGGDGRRISMGIRDFGQRRSGDFDMTTEPALLRLANSAVSSEPATCAKRRR